MGTPSDSCRSVGCKEAVEWGDTSVDQVKNILDCEKTWEDSVVIEKALP